MTGMNFLSTSSLALREEFDRAFAVPPNSTDAGVQQLLAIRAGGLCYALRLSSMRGLFVDRRVHTLPSRLPEMLGLTGLRGQAVPVFDLAALLGMQPAPAPRWLAVANHHHSVAFAFEHFESHYGARAEDYVSAPPHPFAEGAVRIDGTPRTLINLQSLIDDLERRCLRLGGHKP